MKQRILLILIAAIVLAGCNQQTNSDDRQSINSVVGDVSFIDRFGTEPDGTTDENLRITTHLEYMEQLLRQRDVSSLSSGLRVKRTKMLDLLHEYWSVGSYPKNHDFKDERKPCFIDKDGNICAVGYLVEQTAGLGLAEQINSLFKYSRIYDMESEALVDWVANSGLTLKEFAMIQPAYSTPDPESYIEPGYGISSSILSGVNLSLLTLNAVQMSKSSQSKAVPILGLIAGTGQLALGIIKFPEELMTMHGLETNEGEKAVSMINIGLGTSSLIVSTYNLLSNKQPKKDKVTAWNVYSYQAAEHQIGFKFAFVRRF